MDSAFARRGAMQGDRCAPGSAYSDDGSDDAFARLCACMHRWKLDVDPYYVLKILHGGSLRPHLGDGSVRIGRPLMLLESLRDHHVGAH
mmetsp:Transcript_83366/g.269757  ORF Transcript_83366/g.269757 Transcript_83366/m.269757 type:complete len:89 (+) Transcript_83366:194-460(+)